MVSSTALCNVLNENEKHKKECDLTQKYWKVWDTFVFNLNTMMKKGGANLTVDETTWPSAYYGPVY